MNYEEYLKLLSKLVSFKSISTDPAYHKDIEALIAWLKTLLTKNGFSVKLLKGPNTNPVIFAHAPIDPKRETVLLYGHYDVQPAAKSDGWGSDPFTLTQKAGRLIARGVVDNKGQFLIHLATILNLIQLGKLKYNVKVLLEGNEETANEDLSVLVRKYKRELSADKILISDGELTGDSPVVDTSFRGGFNMKVTYTTANTPVHSGIYGGAIPNAAFELTKTLAKLYNSKNKVSFANFYDGVPKPSKAQVVNNVQSFVGFAKVKESMGVSKELTEEGIDFLTQTGLRPTIQISGLKAGYIGNGFANIVPNTAEARLNIRTAPTQDYKTAQAALIKFLNLHTPVYVRMTYEVVGGHQGIAFPTNTKQAQEIAQLLQKSYGKRAIFKNVGGAIPVVADFKHIFGKDTISVGLGNEDCNMHGINENFKIDLVKKGLKFSQHFFSK